MSLQCPYEGCYRTFTKQQALSQHIQNRHIIVEHEISIINKDDVNLFQDEKLFENLEDEKLFEDLGDEKPFENLNLLKVNFGIQFIYLLMYMTINILL
jgi:hypothetical protein